MLSSYKQFVLRGNVVDLAVGVVIGAAFGGVVTALVKSLIEPLIALLVGKPDFTAVTFTVGSTVFPDWRFRHRHRELPARRRCDLLLCGHPHQCSDRPRPQIASARRSNHQEVSRVSERDSDRRPPLRPLRPAGREQSSLIVLWWQSLCFTPAPSESRRYFVRWNTR